MYRWHMGLVGLAAAAEWTPQRVSEKLTLPVVQGVKAFTLKWGRK